MKCWGVGRFGRGVVWVVGIQEVVATRWLSHARFQPNTPRHVCGVVRVTYINLLEDYKVLNSLIM